MLEIPTLDQASLERLVTRLNLSFRARFATPNDIPNLLDLINSAYRYENEGSDAFKRPDALRVDEAKLTEEMEKGVVVVAISKEDDKKILGCVQYKDIPPTPGSSSQQGSNAYFGMLAVGEQRRGTGTALVGLAEEIGRFRDHNLMEIQVVNHAAHLLRWYDNLGYEIFRRSEFNEPFIIRSTHFVLMRKAISTRG